MAFAAIKRQDNLATELATVSSFALGVEVSVRFAGIGAVKQPGRYPVTVPLKVAKLALVAETFRPRPDAVAVRTAIAEVTVVVASVRKHEGSPPGGHVLLRPPGTLRGIGGGAVGATRRTGPDAVREFPVSDVREIEDPARTGGQPMRKPFRCCGTEGHVDSHVERLQAPVLHAHFNALAGGTRLRIPGDAAQRGNVVRDRRQRN